MVDIEIPDRVLDDSEGKIAEWSEAIHTADESLVRAKAAADQIGMDKYRIEKLQDTQKLMTPIANTIGLDGASVAQGAADMKGAFDASGLNLEEVKLPDEKTSVADSVADEVVLRRVIDAETKVDQNRLYQFGRFVRSLYESTKARMKRVAKEQVNVALDAKEINGAAYLDAVKRGVPEAELAPLRTRAVESQKALDAALELDPNLKAKIEEKSGSKGWDLFKKILKYGAIIGSIYLFLKGIADDLSGCFMYSASQGQDTQSVKLPCPASEHQDHCGCQQTVAATCPAALDVNSCTDSAKPYCCNADSEGYHKPCCGIVGSSDGFLYYAWKEVTPWDLPGLLLKAAADAAKVLAEGALAFLKYLPYILLGIGIILLLAFGLPALINLFKK